MSEDNGYVYIVQRTDHREKSAGRNLYMVGKTKKRGVYPKDTVLKFAIATHYTEQHIVEVLKAEFTHVVLRGVLYFLDTGGKLLGNMIATILEELDQYITI